MSDRTLVGTDLEFTRYLKEHGGGTMKKCFQCATCSVACDLSPKEYAFPRKEMVYAGWGLKDKLVSDPDIWLCHGCMECSKQCPRGARPADLMAAVRNYIYKTYAFPNFMGKALGSPKYLIWLLIVPMILIFGLILVTQEGNLGNLFPLPEGQFKYLQFIAHGPLEMLFIFGNLLVFGFAYIGFKRYWEDLEKGYNKPSAKGFVKSLIEVIMDLVVHKKFKDCKTNSNRFYGHFFVFYGFAGALIATAIVVVDLFGHKLGLFDGFLPEHMNLPLYLLGGIDPTNSEHLTQLAGLITKSIGMLGGILMMIGGLLMIVRRQQALEREGKSTYSDLLFLWTLWGVAATGMLLVFFRLLELPAVGYLTYYIHLVLVFFLLWYMPFSKFAHMVYRLLGLTFLKMHGRENKPEIFTKN